MSEPTLEQVTAELARMEEWAEKQFLVLPESREGQRIDALRRAKVRMEGEAQPQAEPSQPSADPTDDQRFTAGHLRSVHRPIESAEFSRASQETLDAFADDEPAATSPDVPADPAVEQDWTPEIIEAFGKLGDFPGLPHGRDIRKAAIDLNAWGIGVFNLWHRHGKQIVSCLRACRNIPDPERDVPAAMVAKQEGR